jgi:hypothetical protein
MKTKTKTTRPLLSALIVLIALFSPLVAEASCPTIVVECPNGKLYSCSGTQQGDNCIYSASCLNGGKCKAELEEPDIN